jgi:hypothetical protein
MIVRLVGVVGMAALLPKQTMYLVRFLKKTRACGHSIATLSTWFLSDASGIGNKYRGM